MPAMQGASRRQLLALGAAACAGLGLGPAHAADDVLRLVVGTPAGGAVDIYGRALAAGLTAELGRTVVVENRSGANGNISAQYVLQQPHDGKTLWVGTQSMVEINPVAFERMPWKPEDFIPLVRGVEAPLVLVTHPSVPAKDFESLIQWLKSKPGTGYASFSPGTPSHFLGFQLSEHYKLDMVHVPYRGSAPQTADLVGGHALLGFAQIQTTLPMLRDGRLRAIATTGAKRSRFLPDAPTFAELGLPEMTTTIWFGILAPVKTPQAWLDVLLPALVKAHARPEVKEHLETAGYDVSGESGKGFADSIVAERKRWAGLVKASGFHPEN